jgi:hypothetical protein
MKARETVGLGKVLKPIPKSIKWRNSIWTEKLRTKDVAIYETTLFKVQKYIVIDIFEVDDHETYIVVERFGNWFLALRKMEALLDYAPMPYLKIIKP